MKKMSVFFRFAAAALCFASATVFAEVVEIQQSEDMMAAFLQKFPELSNCTEEQQQGAFAFFQETQKVESLLRDASRALDNSNGEEAQDRVSEAAEILKRLSE